MSKPGPPVRSLSRSVLHGVSWLFVQNVGARVIGLLSQLLLARLLAPAQFGVLGLAGTVIAIVSVVVGFGIEDVLLQRQKRIRFWITPAFWASLALGILGMLAVALAAPWTAAAYGAPEVRPVLFIMAIAIPFTAMSAIPAVMIRAALKFRLLAVFATVELIATQALTIVLAANDFGVYSFAIPIPLVAAARLLTLWRLTRPRLRPLRLRRFRYIGPRSAAVLGSRLLITAVAQADYFTLGLMASQTVVGAYYFAFRLAVQPVHMLAGNLSNVLFPVLAGMTDEPVRQRAAALKAASILSYSVMPYCFIQAAVADPAMRWMFGSKWEAAIPLVQILSIGLGFDAVSWVAGSLITARGEFNRSFKYSCFFASAFFAVVWIGAKAGSAIGVSLAVSLFYMFSAPIYSFLVFRSRDESTPGLLDIFVIPFTISLVSIGAAYALAAAVDLSPLFQIAVIGTAGSGLYVVLLRFFAPAVFERLMEKCRWVLALSRPAL